MTKKTYNETALRLSRSFQRGIISHDEYTDSIGKAWQAYQSRNLKELVEADTLKEISNPVYPGWDTVDTFCGD